MDRRTAYLVLGALAVVLLGACVTLYALSRRAVAAVGDAIEPVIAYAQQALSRVTPGARSRDVAQAICDAGAGWILGPVLAFSYHESGHVPTRVNPGSGAAGIMQAMPHLWSWFGLDAESVLDLGANVRAVVRHQTLPHAERVAALGDIGLEMQTCLIYLGHCEGGSPMDSAISEIRATGEATWETALAGVKRAWAHKGGRDAEGFHNSRAPRTIPAVGKRAASWLAWAEKEGLT